MRCVFHPVATVGACLLALSPCARSAETLTRVFHFAPPTVITLADNTSRVTVEGCAPDVRSALPVLPVRGATFTLPDGFEVETVTIKPLVENELPLPGPLEWGQPPRIPGAPPAPAIGPDAAVYAQTDPYPDLTLTTWRVDRCRDAALLSVPLYPVRYLPAARRLLAAESLAVTVSLRPAPPLPPAPPPRLAQALGGTRRAMTPPAAFELSPETPCTYLVLSTSNLIHHAPGPWNLQALCEARARSGYAPGLVTVEWVAAQYDGPDLPAKIRAFLQEAYAQWGIRDLLIVGTFDLIPARKLYISVTDILSTVTAEIPSDAIYYGCLDGPFDGNGNGRYGEITDGLNGKDVDLIAEIMVGRFPVATTDELAHMVRKTLRHESATAAELAPNAFLAEKVNFGSVVYATGFMEELRWGTNTYALVSMGYENSPYADVFDTSHTLYDSDLGLWDTTDALNHLNRDYFSINHLGHGSATTCMKIPLSKTNHQATVAAFTNSLPYFIYSQACDCGAFDRPDCFAEQIVTVSNAACAAVMNARAGWEFVGVIGGHSHRFHRSFLDAALRGTATRLGAINEASRRANLHMLVPYAANHWRWVYYELNLFGDPALSFAPALNIVPPVITHEPLINTYDTQTAYRVTCTLEPLGLYDPESVRLLWQTDRAPGVIHTQQMTQLSGNLFEGAIAPQPARTRVTYRLTAANHAGYEGGWPADADNASFHVTDRLNLEVRGSPFDIGTVAPDYGTTYFASGLVATATAPPLVPVTDSTRYAATGFFGTGSTPQSGTNLTVSFPVATHSMLVWLWQRQHRLTLTSAHPAFPAQHLWGAEGQPLAVPPAPATLTNDPVPHVFTEWRLDGARSPSAPAACAPAYGTLSMDTPHTLEAIYLPADLDADDNGLADWWEIRYTGTNGLDAAADDDLDGFTNAEEFADRTNPLDAASVPAPPVITHEPLDEFQTRPGPFTITALITDTHAVTAAVEWRRRTDPWQTTVMTPLSNDLFTAAILDPSTPGDDVEYRITAVDPDGRVSVTETFFFFVYHPVADTSRFHDIAHVALPTQAPFSAAMNLHNTGNAPLEWSLRFARDESITTTNLLHWDWRSLGQAWQVSTNRSVSPPYALHAVLVSRRLPNTPERATITLPPSLIGANARFSFNYWIHSEVESRHSTRTFDGGIVEISADGGTTFEQLRGTYTHTIYGWACSPWPDGTPCFAGNGTEGWRTATFDLAALYPEQNGFAGRTLLFRFHYGGDNNTDREGWYIDDITLTPLLAHPAFAPDVAINTPYSTSGGYLARINWGTFPAGMTLRDDTIRVFIDSNDPVTPHAFFDWQLAIRDFPRLTAFTAAQSTDGDGLVYLAANVADDDGEPVSLAFQWSADGGAHWQTAALTNLTADFGAPLPFVPDDAVPGLPTATNRVNVTNTLAAVWPTHDVLPPPAVTTQALLRVTADNGYFQSAFTSAWFTVDNAPPSFLPGVLAFAPLSAIGTYAITTNDLTVSWPAAVDNPATNLTYQLSCAAATAEVTTVSATLCLTNALDREHLFRVVAIDPAGNRSQPLEAFLLVLDADGDIDADGMTSADEEIAGTDATDPTDRLAVSFSRTPQGTLVLVWNGVAGRLYTVETSPTLQPPAWQPLPGCIDMPGTGAPLVVDPPVDAPSAFFRIKVRVP